MGTFGRTVRDATYVLDAIYGVDARDNYTSSQVDRTPAGGYAQFLTNRTALQGAVFGLPWESFWVYTEPEQLAKLRELLDLLTSAGATIVNGTEILNYEVLVSSGGWDWDWGTTRGFPNESEFTYVAVDFYNNINTYLAGLSNTRIRSLEDIVEYNNDNVGTEGGLPGVHPAFASGQDSFLASLATGGVMNETYWQALEFCQGGSRRGIDTALGLYGGRKLDGLLVPPDVGQSYQIAAQAGYPVITVPAGINDVSHMPFGLAIMQTAFGEAELIRWASAIEDLQLTTCGNPYRRTLPRWYGYLERNIPVPFSDF